MLNNYPIDSMIAFMPGPTIASGAAPLSLSICWYVFPGVATYVINQSCERAYVASSTCDPVEPIEYGLRLVSSNTASFIFVFPLGKNPIAFGVT